MMEIRLNKADLLLAVNLKSTTCIYGQILTGVSRHTMRVWHQNVEMRDRAIKPNWLHLRKCEDNGLNPPKKNLSANAGQSSPSLSYNIPNPNIWTFLTLIQIYWPLVIKNEQFYENLLAVFRSGFNKYSLKRNRYLLQRDRIISDTQEHKLLTLAIPSSSNPNFECNLDYSCSW